MRRLMLNTSGLVLGIALAHPVAAQDAVPAADASGEIIVTAERRAVGIQRAPISITAIAGDTLARQGITSPSAIQQLVPSVKFVEIGMQPSLLIRGVGQVVANVFNDPSASFNIDGVSIVRPIGINGLLFDLNRVEILKGPQGTLYGRNATVGAINVLSRNPVDELEMQLSLELADYDTVKATGIVNVPITSTLAVRAGFQTNRRDGYLSNGTDDADSIGGRVKVRWEPTSAFSAQLTGTLFQDTGRGTGDVPLKSATGSFLDPDNPYFVPVGPSILNGALAVPVDASQNLRNRAISGEVNWDFGGAALTVIPAYIKTDYAALTYNGGFRQDIVSDDEQTSVEARLASSGDGALKWLVGGYYLFDVQASFNDNKTTVPNRQLRDVDRATLRSYAAFAQGTYSLTERLRATAGVRYSNDRKTIRGTTRNVRDIPGSPQVGPTLVSTGDATFDNVSYRVGVDFDLAPDSLLYANISTGYKAGGFQPGIPPNVYGEEDIKSYQVGIKNRLFDRRVTLNVEAWYWDYSGYQFVQFGFINPLPNFDLTTINADKLEDYGVEVQSSIQITDNDRFTADVAYVVAEFTDFVTPAFVFPPAFNNPSTNYSGQTLNRSPRWSTNFSYSHIFNLANGASVDFTARTQIESRQKIVPQNVIGQTIGGYHVTDAELSYITADERFRLTAFVTNIEDEPVIYFAGITPAGKWGHPRPPRVIGMRGSARF